QVTLFPGQTGTTDAGEIAFAWRDVVIDVNNDIATWTIDGLLIATVDLTTVTLGGSNILFGHSDTNGSASSDPNNSLLNVTLIDNIVVTPEPASLALLALGGVAMLRRRR
ncbi:MAG: PEP-CTERM sorting domain-containing protein, partial [Phycisphaerales bacterium]|nr:PEP-CTERM sorting domain-containing protein [Phycisphaerales bacterium]